MKIINNTGSYLPNKINFGCGNNLLDDYLNIDVVEPSNNTSNYVIGIGQLTNPQVLPNDYFVGIKAQMVLEHIHIDILPSVIYTMSCLLRDKGIVQVDVPNFQFFAEQFANRENFELKDLLFIREATFQLLDPMLILDESTQFRGHQSLWTPRFATYLFNSEGFAITEMEEDSPILSFIAEKQNRFSIGIGAI